MILEHRGARPTIDSTACVAPTAVVCGDVHVGRGARILFGAVLIAEDGRVEVGRNCVVMENPLVRGRSGHPARLGEDVLAGPPAHVNGCEVAKGCFSATGWIAAGHPAQPFPPERHDELWAVQPELDFHRVTRGAPPEELMRRRSELFGAHGEDSECG